MYRLVFPLVLFATLLSPAMAETPQSLCEAAKASSEHWLDETITANWACDIMRNQCQTAIGSYDGFSPDPPWTQALSNLFHYHYALHLYSTSGSKWQDADAMAGLGDLNKTNGDNWYNTAMENIWSDPDYANECFGYAQESYETAIEYYQASIPIYLWVVIWYQGLLEDVEEELPN